MILALESSCDETAVAVFDPVRGVVGEWVHSQVALHESYGGVVPDLASREHLTCFAPLLQRALAVVPARDVTAVAVTHGPGLAACLAMGVAAAKSLALAWRVPVIGVNHLRAHAFSPFMEGHAKAPAEFEATLEGFLPHLGLLVSGGNTALYTIDRDRRVRVLAATMDDAAGEALDKGAKLLGLGYPGGPEIEKLARSGNRTAFAFPKAIARKASLEFSFSGLKTSLRYQLEKMSPAEIEARKADLAASYQAAVIDALVRKTALALDRGFGVERSFQSSPTNEVFFRENKSDQKTFPNASERRGQETPPYKGSEPFRSLGLSGGVANNGVLRAEFSALGKERGRPVLAALPRHTGDNAAMIGFTAWIDRETGGLARDGLGLGIAPSLPLATDA